MALNTQTRRKKIEITKMSMHNKRTCQKYKRMLKVQERGKEKLCIHTHTHTHTEREREMGETWLKRSGKKRKHGKMNNKLKEVRRKHRRVHNGF